MRLAFLCVFTNTCVYIYIYIHNIEAYSLDLILPGLCRTIGCSKNYLYRHISVSVGCHSQGRGHVLTDIPEVRSLYRRRQRECSVGGTNRSYHIATDAWSGNRKKHIIKTTQYIYNSSRITTTTTTTTLKHQQELVKFMSEFHRDTALEISAVPSTLMTMNFFKYYLTVP